MPALAAGCPVVIKPCELTPFDVPGASPKDARPPDGVLNVVTGLGGDVGSALAGHRDVDVVTFTGSTPVGRKVMAAAAACGHRVQLELGGEAPFVVSDDADLDAAIQGAAADQHRSGLQRGHRAIVARELYDDFVAGGGEVFSKVVHCQARDERHHGHHRKGMAPDDCRQAIAVTFLSA